MEVRKYHLPPTALMPNSPLPLLHYRNLSTLPAGHSKASTFSRLCKANGWQVQWIYRYGETQRSHYHSTAHECMVVLSGTATIRFGAADVLDENGEVTGEEEGGIELEAREGDVFVLPAGTAHKTFYTQPKADFRLLSPGDGHQIDSSGMSTEEALDRVELTGFTMCGAYPKDSSWDSLKGGEQSQDEFEKVWTVPKPERDPVLGIAGDGLVGSW